VASSAIEIIPFGNRVYLTQPTRDTIAGYTIFGNTGALKLLLNSPFAASGAPIAIDFDLSSHFAYTANSSDDSVSVFLVDQKTGNLVPTRLGPFQAGSHPMAVTVASQLE
jgi:6-phosphogluconolactonase (cycloisomerase 2 family)